VQALVLENPGGLAPVDDRAAQIVLAAMARFFDAGARGAAWFPLAFAAYYRFCVLAEPAARDQRRRIVACAYEMAPLLAAAWRSFAAPDAYLGELAPEVRCPVHFAWAERDAFVSLKRSLAVIERFPAARVQRFRASHAAHLERPEELEAAVEAFLDEVTPAVPGRSVVLALTAEGGAGTRFLPSVAES
jgi:4,5:9,10-diseco-3-hydroxy-5,9,17-trioxoandrosta-1(10),2-diene-4-oate hydrolase